jgi:hypothetical protein
MSQLIFHKFARSDLFAGAGIEKGRAVTEILVTLRDQLTATEQSASLKLHLRGPADVESLLETAIVKTAPKPSSREAETTKLAHVDFGDTDLPWRFSFEQPPQPRPWLVLITGTADELELVNGAVKIKDDGVLLAHDLKQSAKWAHVMEDEGRTVSRLVSPRGLENGGAGLLPNREYIAALVPAYRVLGNGDLDDAWVVELAKVTRVPDGNVLPAFYGWRYWTADAGDFVTLATRLHTVAVGNLGRSRLGYDRSVPVADLEVRGAITSLAPSAETKSFPVLGQVTTWPVATDPAPKEVLDSVDALQTELSDPVRPVIALPTYGVPWIETPADTDWGRSLNRDPRFRGIAGLGAWLAMQAQEELIDAARLQTGALAEASQRVRQLAFGLMATRSLWRRRLPADPVQQLYLFGPTLRRLPARNGATDGASAMDLVTGGARSLPRAALSTAARRLLRPGDGIGRHAQPHATDRGTLLNAINHCAPPPPRTTAHVDEVLKEIGLPPLRDFLKVRPLPDKVRDLIRRIVARGGPLDVAGLVPVLASAISQSLGVPPTFQAQLSAVLQPFNGKVVTEQLLEDLVRPFLGDLRGVGESPKGAIGIANAVLLGLGEPRRPCEKVDLTKLGTQVGAAIDPLGDKPPALVRVAATIDGIDIRSLESPEVCLGMDYEVWKLLREKAKSWLLPGIEDLEKDAVVAMESNPAFIDALLVGMNTQFLAELRWRNMAIAPKCTPLRWFWGNLDHTVVPAKRTDDIRGIDQWEDNRLGDNQHQVLKPGDDGNRDLVMVFRTDLFRRYPSTIVYLLPNANEAALSGTRPDFQLGPAKAPKIKGTIGEDVTFFIFDINPKALKKFFLVLDEPPAELRFRGVEPDSSKPPSLFAAAALQSAHSADFARNTIDQPVRVAIDGKTLAWEGLPA